MYRFLLIFLVMICSFQNVVFSAEEGDVNKKVKEWTLQIPGFKSFAKKSQNLPEQLDILSFSHGIDLFANMQDFSIVTYVNPLTPYLYKAVLEGQTFPKVIFNLKQKGSLLRYELYNAVVTCVRPGGSNYGDEKPLNEVSFNFEKVKIIYKDEQSENKIMVENRSPKKKKWTLQIPGIKSFAKGGKNLPEKIEILSFNYYKDSETKVDNFMITTSVNPLTPYFFQAFLEKQPFPKVIFNLKQKGSLLRYELYDATITAVRPGGSNYSEQEKPYEEISFAFKKIEIFYEDEKSRSKAVAK